MPEKPKIEDIADLHYRLYTKWQPKFAEDDEFRALVHQLNDIDRLDETADRDITPKTLHSGRAGGIIEHAVGLLMTPPSFHVEPRKQTTEAKWEADNIERVLAKIFEKYFLANDFWQKVAREMLTYGRSLAKGLAIPHVWTIEEGFPVRKKRGRGMEPAEEYLRRVEEWKATAAKFPFVFQHIPVKHALPYLDSNDNVLACLEFKAVPAKLLAEDMKSVTVRELLSSGSLRWYDDLPVIEYIDQDFVGYYLLSTTPINESHTDPFDVSLGPRISSYEELRVTPHGLGRCPVVFFPGLVTDETDYRLRYKSFLADAKEALETHDFLLSRLKTMVWAYYLPSFLRKIPTTYAQAQGKRPDELRVKLGAVTTVFSDEEFAPLQMPGNLPDATLLMAQVDDQIQRHTIEDVLFGRVEGSAPAYQVNLRMNVARSKFTPLAHHMARGVVELMDCFLRAVEQLGEDVIIDGERITPAQAKQTRGRVTVSIQTRNMFDRNSDIGAMNLALQAGFPWDWAAREIVGVENPALLRREKMLELLEQQPDVQQRLIADILEDLDLRIEQDEFTDAAGLDQNGLPPAFQEALAAAVPLAAQRGPGLGRGPFPPGAAPQTIQGGRGLNTPKQQPEPPDMSATTEPIPGVNIGTGTGITR